MRSSSSSSSFTDNTHFLGLLLLFILLLLLLLPSVLLGLFVTVLQHNSLGLHRFRILLNNLGINYGLW